MVPTHKKIPVASEETASAILLVNLVVMAVARFSGVVGRTNLLFLTSMYDIDISGGVQIQNADHKNNRMCAGWGAYVASPLSAINFSHRYPTQLVSGVARI
jgi:hypothetical protein